MHTHAKNEASIVKWYLEIMEDGQDTKEIVQQYGILKKDHNSLKQQSTKTIARLEKENERLKEQMR